MRSGFLAIALLLPLAGSVRGGNQFPARSVDISMELSPNISASTWVNGYLPKYSRSIGGAKPTVWMYDRNGAMVIHPVEIWFPEAGHVDIKSVTADAHGALYASAQVWTNDGRGTGLIAKVPQSGGKVDIIRTDEFLPVAIAASDNGEIWGFGLPLLLQTARRSTENYQTIWKFDSSGRLLTRLIPRSLFGADVIPTHSFGDVGAPMIFVRGKRIGVFSATASRWLELDSDTGAILVDLKVEKLLANDGVSPAIFEIAMIGANCRVIAFPAFRFQDASHINQLYELDRKTGRWRALGRLSTEYNGLFGFDGDALVLRAGTKSFGWFPLERIP